MKGIARLLYHFSRNLLFPNYRYYRISPNIRGNILFYDRDRSSFFRVHSRGLIDSVTANQIYSNNEYNLDFIGRREQVEAVYERILDDGKVPLIVDCGANIGLSPQYLARTFPRARIVAVEPDRRNFEQATRNCAAFDNIHLVHAAIGSAAGFVAIDDADVDANAFRVSRVDSDQGIPVRTVPDLVAEHPGTELFIVKVDIEGFERDLFDTNTDWIADCSVLVVELHDWMLPTQASSGNFLRAVSHLDRDFLFKGESVFSIRNDR